MKYEVYKEQGFVIVELTGNYKCFRAAGNTKEQVLELFLKKVNVQLEIYIDAINEIKEGLKQILND